MFLEQSVYSKWMFVLSATISIARESCRICRISVLCNKSANLWIRRHNSSDLFVHFSVHCLSLKLPYMYICRSLHCNRISIHKHLVVSFIIRFIVLIAMLEPIVFQHVPFSYLVVVSLLYIHSSLESMRIDLEPVCSFKSLIRKYVQISKWYSLKKDSTGVFSANMSLKCSPKQFLIVLTFKPN